MADPFPIWDELRATCPVAHSDRYGGTWLPVRYGDVSAVAYDTEHFTSRAVVVSEVRPGPDDPPAPVGAGGSVPGDLIARMVRVVRSRDPRGPPAPPLPDLLSARFALVSGQKSARDIATPAAEDSAT